MRHFPRVHPWQQVMEPAEGLGTPRESDLGGQWGCITELPEDWGSRETDSWGRRKDLVHTGAQGKEQRPHKRLIRTCCECLLRRRGVDRGLPWGRGPCIHWVQVLRRRPPSLPLPLPGFVLRPNNREGTAPPINRKLD